MSEETKEISKNSARVWVDYASAEALCFWHHCPREGCVYCDEVERLRAEKLGGENT